MEAAVWALIAALGIQTVVSLVLLVALLRARVKNAKTWREQLKLAKETLDFRGRYEAAEKRIEAKLASEQKEVRYRQRLDEIAGQEEAEGEGAISYYTGGPEGVPT